MQDARIWESLRNRLDLGLQITAILKFMGILNFMKGFFKAGSHPRVSTPETIVSSPQRIQFSFLDKYKLSFDNILVFTGGLLKLNDNIAMGNKLTIPSTQKHPAFDLKIGPSWQTSGGTSSIAIKFNSIEERETLANCDFSNETFYIEN